MKYEVSAELLQRILDLIGSSTTTKPVSHVVSIVDAIRNLEPVKENEDAKKENIES